MFSILEWVKNDLKHLLKEFFRWDGANFQF